MIDRTRQTSLPVWEASRAVVAWAAQECEWQQSGEQSVLWMLDGWEFMAYEVELTPKLVQRLGGIVEPRKNTGNGWRTCAVRVGWDVKMAPSSVPRAMARILQLTEDHASWESAMFDEWFRQYEEIHPFADGNGRTGNILWNWLRGTLDEPEFPPNFWGDPRR